MCVCVCVCVRVEGGSDDSDNLGHLGHFFGGSSGSHLQTKLSGGGLECTCTLKHARHTHTQGLKVGHTC